MRRMLDVLANNSKGYLVGDCDVEEDRGANKLFL